MALGDHEVRIDESGKRLVSGDCAAGDGRVCEDEPSVVRYHDDHTGGIFHARCEPVGDGWYSVEGEE